MDFIPQTMKQSFSKRHMGKRKTRMTPRKLSKICFLYGFDAKHSHTDPVRGRSEGLFAQL